MFNSIPEKVTYIIDKLIQNGYKAYLCGGAVRDMIIGLTPKDFDITTSATPNQVKEVFKDEKVSFINTGIEFGSIVINIDNNLYDITTFRADGEYSDSRRPDNITYSTELKEDIIRRDFTINGLVYNKYENIVDLVRGLKDIEKGLIRAIGEPIDRFKEDNLRVLRAIRFALRYGFNIEENTLVAMLETDINVSKERIYKELKEILPNLYKLKDLYNSDKLLWIIIKFITYGDRQIIEFINIIKPLFIIAKYRGNFEASLIALFDTYPKLEKRFTEYLKTQNPLCLENNYAKILKNAIDIKQHLRNGLDNVEEANYYFRKILKTYNYNDIIKVVEITFNEELIEYLKFELKILIQSISGYKKLAINGTDIINEFGIKGKLVGMCLDRCEYEILHIPALNTRESLLKICQEEINKNILVKCS